MDDVETMKLPNIYFAEWITNVLLSVRHESKSNDFVAETAKALKLHNQNIEIFCIWTKALKSPSTSLKQKVFQILSSILHKALKLKLIHSSTWIMPNILMLFLRYVSFLWQQDEYIKSLKTTHFILCIARD